MKLTGSRILPVILILVLLAACAQANTPTDPTQDPTLVPPAQLTETPIVPIEASPVELPTADPGAIDAEETPTALPQAAPATLTILTHDSFAASEEVILAFERENNVRLVFVQGGDAGSTLNRAILTRESPVADVLYGLDNTFLSRALEEDIFEPYESPLLADISEEFKLDPQNRVSPVDYGDVCINYDRAYFEENNLAVPQSLEELTQPEYRDLLVAMNPATSSPGLAFLLATIAHFGEDGYLDYWQALRDNGVVVVNDWQTAYYTNFSGSAGMGPQPMVVSYGSSPVAEVVFAETQLAESPTGSIMGPDTCFRQIEFVGILRNAQRPDLAQRLVDFMLSPRFQEDMPLQMFVFPVNQQAELPEAYQLHAQIPDQPASLDPELIAQNRENWVQSWTDVVLR